MLYGDRGIGKTSTLRKLDAIARASESDALTCISPMLGDPPSPEALVSSLVRDLKLSLDAQSPRSSLLRAVLRSLGSIQFGPLGVTFQNIGPVSDAQGMWRTFVGGLSNIPLCFVGLDNCELLGPAALETVKMLAEWETPVPTILVVSGAREFAAKLSSAEGRHIGRVFSLHTYALDAFSEEETEEALNRPLAIAGASMDWTPEAVSLVHYLTMGQPHLVQCLGHAAFDASIRTIDEARVRAKLTDALDLARTYLSGRCDRLNDKRVQLFRAVSTTGRSAFSRQDLYGRGFKALDVRFFVKVSILRKIPGDRFEVAVPPLAAFHEVRERNLEL